MTYHFGELQVQAQAGVQLMAQRVGRGIRNQMPPIAQEFIAQQVLAVASSVDSAGQVWTSLLAGQAGFMRGLDAQTVQILTPTASGDVLWANLAENTHIGLVVITFADRQRVRLNGFAEVRPDGLIIHLEQAYSNCPQYIQARIPQPIERPAISRTLSENLSTSQQTWLEQADTFFIGSFHAEGGADASHRGGKPGFVRLLDKTTLEFPDYSGNKMFNTLGNIAANPHVGLLFLDFAHGATLQLTGEAEIIWDATQVATFPGAERIIRFRIAQSIETRNTIPLTFDFLGYSPVLP